MVSTNEFKNGIVIKYDGHLYKILDFMHVKPGKGSAFVRSKLRDIRTGAVIDYTFNAGEKVEVAEITRFEMQYLYDTGEALAFMDNVTYEQLEIEYSLIEYERKFLRENANVTIEKYGEEIIGVTLPDKVALRVTQTEPAVKGDTKSGGAQKDAIVETGLLVKVPLFIENDEEIIVNTETGKYCGRA